MTTHAPPTTGPAGAGRYAGAAGTFGSAAPTRPATPWYRRLWVLITGGVVAVLLVFGSGYAAGVFATSTRGPGGMSFDQGDRGQFPGGPGSGELPDGFPGGPGSGELPDGFPGSGSTGTGSGSGTGSGT